MIKSWSIAFVLAAAFFTYCTFISSQQARATFPGEPGSIQYRNPAWLRPYAPVILTASQNNQVTVDWRDGPFFQITLKGNYTFNAPINVGSNCIQIALIQDTAGSRTASWSDTAGGSGWKFSGGNAATLTTIASAEDIATACPLFAGQANEASINIGLNYK